MSITALRHRSLSVALFLAAILFSSGPLLASSPTANDPNTVYVYQGGWSQFIYKTSYSEVTKFSNADTLPAVATTSGGALNIVVPTSGGTLQTGTSSIANNVSTGSLVQIGTMSANIDRPIFANMNTFMNGRVVSDTGLTLSGGTSSSGSTTSGGTLLVGGTLYPPIDISTGTITGVVTTVGAGTLTLTGTNVYPPITINGGGVLSITSPTSGGTFNIGSTISGIGTVQGGTSSLDNTILTGSITSGLTTVGSGTLTVNNQVDDPATFGTITLSNGQLANIGSTLTLSGAAVTLASTTILSNVTPITLSNPTLTTIDSGTLKLTSPSSLTSNITLLGSSTLTVVSANSQTGGVTELPVPEPGTWLLLITSCICLALARRRFF